MNALSALADLLLPRLAWTAAQATVLIAALWLIVRCMPKLSPAMRCTLWWLVAAQLLLGTVVSSPVQLRWLKPAMHAPAMAAHEIVMHVDGVANVAPMEQTLAPHSPSAWSTWSWSEAVLLLWLSIVLLHVVLALRHWMQSRTLLREARPAASSALQKLCAEQARALGMRRVPALRISDAIVSPQVTGLWRPVVLLPAEQTLSPEEMSMAIAHELAHIRRGDLWLGWVPAIAQRLFFFHPMVGWAMREYAIYREAACDAQVLHQHGAAPQHYGHLLVRLGVVDPMHSSLAGASSTFLHLKRRLIMLQQSVNDTTPRMRGWLLVIAIALIGVLPYRVTASSAPQQLATVASDDAVPPAPPAPPAPPLPAPPAHAIPAAPPAPPAPDISVPAPPPTPPAPAAPDFNADHVHINTRSDADRGITLLDGDTVIVDGSDADLSEAKRLSKQDGSVLLLRQHGKSYVIHDANVIRQARDIYAQSAVLAQEQGELAGQQGSLAGQQAGLAASQAALASRQAEMDSRRLALEAQRDAMRAAAASSEKDGSKASLDSQLRDMDKEQAEKQREFMQLDKASAELSKQEAELSQRQMGMSKQQQRNSQDMERQLDKVLSEAIAKGLAKPVAQ
jgi:bla regulator protein blaR1